MARVNYKNKLQKLFVNNPELIEKYEAMDCTVPVEYCEDDIINAYHNYAKINKSADFNTIVTTAFNLAIKSNINILDAFVELATNNELSGSSPSQQYFKEINDIYNKYNNDYNIEYCEENRDKLIEMNLKTVISIAKKYQGLGLTLNELISAGNLGLVIAYDKFDPSRSKLKDNVLEAISVLNEECSYEELYNVISEFLQYGDIKTKFEDEFSKYKLDHIKKSSIIKWVNSNIYNAKFNSIASMWIRAYILIEIDNYSRIVKKPKLEIYKDKESHGAYKKEITVDIDAPISDDSNVSIIDTMIVGDDEYDNINLDEAYGTFKEGLSLLLTGVKVRDRGIFLKKFGIGIPRPMTPREIADQEGLSIARVSQIFQQVLEQMQRNQIKYSVDESVMFNAVKSIL